MPRHPFYACDGAGLLDRGGTEPSGPEAPRAPASGLAGAIVADAAMRDDDFDERSVEVADVGGTVLDRMDAPAIAARIGSTPPAPLIPADLAMR